MQKDPFIMIKQSNYVAFPTTHLMATQIAPFPAADRYHQVAAESHCPGEQSASFDAFFDQSICRQSRD